MFVILKEWEIYLQSRKNAEEDENINCMQTIVYLTLWPSELKLYLLDVCHHVKTRDGYHFM